MQNTPYYSDSLVLYMRTTWFIKAGVALFVVAFLLTGVGLILTTITSKWSYVGYFAIVAIVSYLAGLQVIGSARRLAIWSLRRGKNDLYRPRAGAKECACPYWCGEPCGCPVCNLEVQTIEGEKVG